MQIRDWLYVEDHCKAIDMVATGGMIGEVYNIGGHKKRPDIFIVKTIIKQLSECLNDSEISEGLIKHVEDLLVHVGAMASIHPRLKQILDGIRKPLLRLIL